MRFVWLKLFSTIRRLFCLVLCEKRIAPLNFNIFCATFFLLLHLLKATQFNDKLKMQKKRLFFLSVLLVSLAVFYSSCSKEDLFAENVQLQSPVGKTWRLQGFANTQNDNVQIAFSQNLEYSYQITFKKDSTWFGSSSTNDLHGKYTIDKVRRLLTLTEIVGTERGEVTSGNLYMYCLQNVSAYEVFENELRLFYTKENYLKYAPYSPSN